MSSARPFPSAVAVTCRSAALYAGAMFVGYAMGIALAFFRINAVETLRSAAESGALGVDQLDPLLRRFGDASEWLSVYRFPGHVVLSAHAWLVTAAVLIAAVLASFAATLRLPVRVAPGGLENAPSDQAASLRAEWRQTLAAAAASLATPAWLFLAGVAGLGGAVLAQVYNVVKCQAAMIRGVPVAPSEPFAGVVALEDGIWLALWAIIPFFVIVLAARARLRRDAEFLARWCLGCGYPTPANGDDASRCPECGTQPVRHTPRRRLSTRGAAIVAALALALLLGVHAFVPRLPGGMDQVMNAAAVDSNVAIVPADTTIVIERPAESIWLRVDETAGGPAGVTLTVAVLLPGQTAPALSRRFVLSAARFASPPQTVSLPGGGHVALSFGWQDDFRRAYVYLTPGGAISIRAVDPSAFPSEPVP